MHQDVWKANYAKKNYMLQAGNNPIDQTQYGLENKNKNKDTENVVDLA